MVEKLRFNKGYRSATFKEPKVKYPDKHSSLENCDLYMCVEEQPCMLYGLHPTQS